jgi:hypothetical protein
LTLLLFALETNFFPAFQVHYVAAATCLFVLISVVGLRQICGWSSQAAVLVLFLCAAHFTFWYAMHVFDIAEFSTSARAYETWDAINHRNPERRIRIHQQIDGIHGRMLIFVRYWPRHIFQEEWVYNAADINAARVVWARDLGEPENQKLRSFYPDRTVWLLEADARPPRLAEYREEQVQPPTPIPVPLPPAQKKDNPPTQPTLRFEDVPR